MNYNEAKKIIEQKQEAHLAYLLCILANKLEIWAPEEFETFKTLYLSKV